jgi:hypothetical protein
MTTYSTTIGSRTAFTITLTSLASATYGASSAVDLHNIVGSATAPAEFVVEVEITPGTVSGNKQAKIFAQVSMDGTNYSTGPTSGTTTTDEPDLFPIGILPLNTNSTLQRKAFPLVAALGFVPYAVKLVVLNDSGAAFAGSGCAAYYTVENGDGR